jgi:hypothetical protein
MLRQLLRLDFPLQRQVAVVEGEHEYPIRIVRRSEHVMAVGYRDTQNRLVDDFISVVKRVASFNNQVRSDQIRSR